MLAQPNPSPGSGRPWATNGPEAARGPPPPPLCVVGGSLFHPTESRSPFPATVVPLHAPLGAGGGGLHPSRSPQPTRCPGSGAAPGLYCPQDTFLQPCHHDLAAAKDSRDKLAECWMPAQAGQGRYEPAAGGISRRLPVLVAVPNQKARDKERPEAIAGEERAFPCCYLQLAPEGHTAWVSAAGLCLRETTTDGTRRPKNPLAASGLSLCFPAGSRVKP